jgi:uncharacterized Fe-S cluster protein YjdI
LVKTGNPYRYEGEEILVTWEKRRCIHAAECVRRAWANKPYCDRSHVAIGFEAE